MDITAFYNASLKTQNTKNVPKANFLRPPRCKALLHWLLTVVF